MSSAHEQKPGEPRSALMRAPHFRNEPVPLASAAEQDGAAGPDAAMHELTVKLEEAYARGLISGRAEVEAAYRQEIDAAVGSLQEAARTLATTREELITQAEVAVRRLAIEIAGHVMRGEVEAGRPLALTLAREAITRLGRPARLEIHVHPVDGALLRGHLEQLTPVTAGAEVEVIDDAAVTRGGCRVGGGELVVDAELTNALQVIAEELGVAAIGERLPGQDSDEIVALDMQGRGPGAEQADGDRQWPPAAAAGPADESASAA